jgi:hypothetical protein
VRSLTVWEMNACNDVSMYYVPNDSMTINIKRKSQKRDACALRKRNKEYSSMEQYIRQLIEEIDLKKLINT